jgi:hypothetical protein
VGQRAEQFLPRRMHKNLRYHGEQVPGVKPRTPVTMRDNLS